MFRNERFAHDCVHEFEICRWKRHKLYRNILQP